MKQLLLYGLFALVLNVSAQQLSPNWEEKTSACPLSEILDSRRFEFAVLNQHGQSTFWRMQRVEIGVTIPFYLDSKVRNFTHKLTTDSASLLNPYLEWELKVEARFVFENDTLHPIFIDGFYTQNYQSFSKNPLPVPKNGQYYTDEEYQKLGGWKQISNLYPFHIRFEPPKSGSWKMQIRIQTREDEYWSDPFSFYVEESENHGYVSVAENKRFLELDGTSFYPVGMNTPWPETAPEFDSILYAYHTIQEQKTTYFRPESYRVNGRCIPRVYEKYKDVWSKMSVNGVNYVRTIMNPVATEIEWENLGDYTNRLNQAQELDDLLAFAESKNIFIHWDLAIHYTFKYNVYAITQWDWIDEDGSPAYCYKKAFNLSSPIDFFTNEQCKKYYKQRLRYIISRWGYSNQIAVWEIMSEISNIGSSADDDSGFYQKNASVFQAWQLEMGAYVKSLYYGKVHLLTASYSGETNPTDSTFLNANYQIMTSNIYDFGKPDFAQFFIRSISKRFLNESDQAPFSTNPYTLKIDRSNGIPRLSYTIKPLMFAETEPVEVGKNCTRSAIEANRLQWQSFFSGLAGSLNWTSWFMTENYQAYSQMQQWISTINFLDLDWHPGASEVHDNDSLKRWMYQPNYAKSMDASWRKVDLSYLRSGQKNEAIGVITNKTYNVYNADTCLRIPVEIKQLEKRESVDVKKEKLKIKGLKRARYRIDYFLPQNQNEPIFTSFQHGKKIKMDLPSIAATKEGYIVLFRVSWCAKS